LGVGSASHGGSEPPSRAATAPMVLGQDGHPAPRGIGLAHNQGCNQLFPNAPLTIGSMAAGSKCTQIGTGSILLRTAGASRKHVQGMATVKVPSIKDDQGLLGIAKDY